MRYYITHRTTCIYESSVTVCHYMARLMPRSLPSQQCPWHEITIHPKPSERAVREDYFGNVTVYFELEGAHQKLEVISSSLVEIGTATLPAPETTPPWEHVRDSCRADTLTPASTAGEFVFASPLIATARQYAEYASPSFPPGRPILQAVCDLNHRINRDFVFDPAATDAATPIDKVFAQRRGVCQDFAQILIACVRSLSLPARYVSGYLETIPPPGKPRLVGADASHAWASVWCGDQAGWIDADPTNNVLPSTRHITVAWGRDFSDVSPLRGVTLGAGAQKLRVAVDVVPDLDS
jgi:transglutaminase-like putative cysteine protease